MSDQIVNASQIATGEQNLEKSHKRRSAPQKKEFNVKNRKNDLLRMLKGAPLSVLHALCDVEEGLTAVELQSETDWSDKPVRRALELLETLGMVQHHGRMKGWTITKKGRSALLALSSRGGRGFEAARPARNGEPGAHNREQRVSTKGGNSSSVSGKRCAVENNPGKDNGINTENGSNSRLENGNYSGNRSENFRVRDSDQIWPEIRLWPESDLNEDINKYQSGLNRSDQALIRPDLIEPSQQDDGSNPGKKNFQAEATVREKRGQGELEALEIFLKLIEIDGIAFKEIMARDNLVDVVGWYWYTLGKEDIRRPNGYVIACLKNKERPLTETYLECARIWLTMSKEDYDDYLKARFRVLGLEDYWRDWSLSKAEMKVFAQVKEHGGLDLFEDFERPILSAE